MADPTLPRHQFLLADICVLDGGLGSELEHHGADTTTPLWSAHILQQSPETVVAVHRAFIEAGANMIETASYQVSRLAYTESGLSPERADAALLQSVLLAREAAAAFPDRRILVAASLGPYGAALHNGAEYHGNYTCSAADMVSFHRDRIHVLATATGPAAPDILAFETLPSLAEAEAIGHALAPYPALAAWFSFTCPDVEHVAHGELLQQCARAVAAFPQTAAIGVNCTHPAHVSALIAQLRAASDKPIIVYPNSGEDWDAEHRCWTGRSAPEIYGAKAAEWFAAGAHIIGGCCRSRPSHIREVANFRHTHS